MMLMLRAIWVNYQVELILIAKQNYKKLLVFIETFVIIKIQKSTLISKGITPLPVTCTKASKNLTEAKI